MNLTGETQPLVEQLMMIKRMQVNIAFLTHTKLHFFILFSIVQNPLRSQEPYLICVTYKRSICYTLFKHMYFSVLLYIYCEIICP